MFTLFACFAIAARIILGGVRPRLIDTYDLLKACLSTDTWLAGIIGMTVGVLWVAAELVRGIYDADTSGSTPVLLLSVASIAVAVIIDPELWIDAYQKGREQ